jgi:hypothetical protein
LNIQIGKNWFQIVMMMLTDSPAPTLTKSDYSPNPVKKWKTYYAQGHNAAKAPTYLITVM